MFRVSVFSAGGGGRRRAAAARQPFIVLGMARAQARDSRRRVLSSWPARQGADAVLGVSVARNLVADVPRRDARGVAVRPRRVFGSVAETAPIGASLGRLRFKPADRRLDLKPSCVLVRMVFVCEGYKHAFC